MIPLLCFPCEIPALHGSDNGSHLLTGGVSSKVLKPSQLLRKVEFTECWISKQDNALKRIMGWPHTFIIKL